MPNEGDLGCANPLLGYTQSARNSAGASLIWDKFFIDRRFAFIRLPLWDEIDKIYQYYLLVWESLLSSPENHIAMRFREETRRTSGASVLYVIASVPLHIKCDFICRFLCAANFQILWKAGRLHVSPVNYSSVEIFYRTLL